MTAFVRALAVAVAAGFLLGLLVAVVVIMLASLGEPV